MNQRKINTQELFMLGNVQDFKDRVEHLDRELKRIMLSLTPSFRMSKDEKLIEHGSKIEPATQALLAKETELVDLFQLRQELKGKFDEIGGQMTGLCSTLSTDIQAELKRATAKTATLNWLIVGLVGLTLYATGSFIGRSVTVPLSRIKGFAVNVARGDLDAKAEGEFKGEMSELRSSIEDMVANLKQKMSEAEEKSKEASMEAEKAQEATEDAENARAAADRARREGMLQAALKLEDVVKRIKDHSQSLSGQAAQVSDGAEAQKGRVGETMAAMEQMNASILEVARNASAASQAADEAREKATAGADVVRRSVETIARVQELSLQLKSNMGELGSRTEAIGRIMDVISDIADQTNLLALNAAIEAARAGDAGRGFAVVADEVRKLAEKTMQATKEVGRAIGDIQEGAEKNIASMEKAVEVVEEATGMANDSGEVLAEIVDVSQISSDQVRSIATASEQQSAASEQINRTMEDVNRISQETAEQMHAATTAISQLNELAEELACLIDELRSTE